MIYAQIHLYYTLPVLAILLLLIYPALSLDPSRTLYPLLAITLISFVYTTPWDNYLIYNGGWSYPEKSVLGIVGYVPVEEYAFFVIQTWITGLGWIGLRWMDIGVPLANLKKYTGLKYSVLSVLGSLTAWGWKAAVPGTSTFYLGIILFWACPVIFLQLWVAFDYIMNTRRHVLIVFCVSTLYLWCVDTIGISSGAWKISKDNILGIMVNDSLPLEEATFFVVTNLMILFGLSAIERTLSILALDPKYPESYSIKDMIYATLSDESLVPTQSINDLRSCLEITKNVSTSFYLSTLFMPIHIRYKLYAFARVADDYIDLAPSKREQEKNLDELKAFINSSPSTHEHPVFRALLTLDLPKTPLKSLLDGFSADVSHVTIENESQLLDYCSQVASTIGVLSLHVLKSHTHVKEAEALGAALQLINIARDVCEDYSCYKRVYLIGHDGTAVQEWIDANGDSEAINKSIEWCLDKSDNIVETGHVVDAIYHLPKSGRRSVMAAYLMYKEIGVCVRQALLADDGSICKRSRYFKFIHQSVGWRRRIALFCGIWWLPEYMLPRNMEK